MTKIINQPNALSTTDSLYPLIHNQLNTLNITLDAIENKESLSGIAEQYRQIASVLHIMEVSPLATLAQFISGVLSAIEAEVLTLAAVQKTQAASQLLSTEFTQYLQTGHYHYQLIINRLHELYSLLQAPKGIDIKNLGSENPLTATQTELLENIKNKLKEQQDHSQKPEAQSGLDDIRLETASSGSLPHFASYIDIDVPQHAKRALNLQTLSGNDKRTLLLAWRYAMQNLLSNDNSASINLRLLQKVSQYLLADSLSKDGISKDGVASQNTPLQTLWYLTEQWLPSIALNSHLKPSQYASVLVGLENILDSQVRSQLQNSNIDNDGLNKQLFAIINQINTLERYVPDATVVVTQIKQETHKNAVLFSKWLNSLGQFIQQPTPEPQALKEGLEAIRVRLTSWGMTPIEQQIETLKQQLSADSQDNGDKQMQIKTKLKELYLQLYTLQQNVLSALISKASSLKRKGSKHNIIKINKLDTQKIRQVRIAVETLKRAFSDYLHQKDSLQLQQQVAFNQLADGFVQLNMQADINVVEQLSQLFEDVVQIPINQDSWAITDGIANALSSLESFMDGLAQHTFNEALFNQIKEGLTQTEHLLNQRLQHSDDDAELSQSTAYQTRDSQTGQSKKVTGSTTSEQIDSEILLATRAALPDDSFEMDEDIRDIFVEEAEEVLDTFERYMPIWQKEPQDLKPLTEIRRGFHTLKGSGRMVGANNVGELAWAVEKLLNRVLDNTITVNAELVNFIVETQKLLPHLVNDFSKQKEPSIDPAVTVLKAQNLLKKRDIEYGLTDDLLDDAIVLTENDRTENDRNEANHDALAPTTQDKETESNTHIPAVVQALLNDLVIPEDEKDTDADFKEIFIEEAQEVLEDIVPRYDDWQKDVTNLEPLIDIRRGFHTLKGSGRMVGANQTAELAWAIENMLNRVLDSSIEPTQGLQALIGDVLGAYPSMVKTFESGNNQYPENMPLWIASAQAYAKKRDNDFDYALLR